ncbi:MAG TPA: hypothetical protein VHZ52_04455 [Acidobacteriaceae bacterium]|jgi:tetratricopeptide (TPR) repeat protein|nr:hypothetical protein [Acidobacteriaceae bacterium]
MPVVSYFFDRIRSRKSSISIACVTASMLLAAHGTMAQTATCPVVTHAEATRAETAYSSGNYRQAEDLYGQELAQHAGDVRLSAALVQTWLHEGEIAQAATQADKIVAANPHSAIALTAEAEVRLHEGQPWLALDTLKEAAAADPCYARISYVRSRALRLNSMYASEREDIQKAYDIDPTDPDIRHAWLSTVSPAREIEGIDSALKTMKDLDADARQKGQESIRSMMTLLSENNQTCQVLPATESATLPLQASYLDSKHIDNYKLDVELPKSKVKLIVDTAASGMYISKAVADLNGFESKAGDPPGTVRVDSAHIGPLEFHDCIVGVSQAPFGGNIDGFIGTDMFAPYLITLDQPGSKLVLAPLPKQASLLPGDRMTSDELKDYTPVYHRLQYLMVPVLLNNKTRRLFVLDTGIRLSTMAPDVAHSVSSTKVNFTNAVETTSGSKLQIYRDNFDFQFANLTVGPHGHILEMDPTAIAQNTGIEVAGMLGFDMLHSLNMHLDYRDGLVKFESPAVDNSRVHASGSKAAMIADALSGETSSGDECQPANDGDRPLTSTLEGKVTGLLDSAHMKPGMKITVSVVKPWADPECTLSEKANLYGHVVEVNSSKSPDSSELALVFDHGDCDSQRNKELALRVIGFVAPPDAFKGLHTVMPGEVAGGGRASINAVAAMGGTADGTEINLNPGGAPKTVHPGIVAGNPKLKLEPLAGPGCSTKITSTERSIHFGTGAELLLSRQTSRMPGN